MRGLLRQDATVNERSALIEAEKANYPIVWMCGQLQVPRSSYYHWARAIETPTAARHQQLTERVCRVFEQKKQRYGVRRIARELNRTGTPVGVGTVATIMREQHLAARQPHRWKKTTVPDPGAPARRDHLKGVFDAHTPGLKLVGDITYLRTDQGWLYLATVIDLATRMVVGWQMADHMRTSIIVEAMQMGIDAGYVHKGAICHSDRGAQYTSTEYARFAQAHGLRLSCGATGVCWDNAVAESFFATLKNEMYYHHRFPTRGRARYAVAEYIEIFYNRDRLHSTLDYRTPLEAYLEATTTDPAAPAAA